MGKEKVIFLTSTHKILYFEESFIRLNHLYSQIGHTLGPDHQCPNNQ